MVKDIIIVNCHMTFKQVIQLMSPSSDFHKLKQISVLSDNWVVNFNFEKAELRQKFRSVEADRISIQIIICLDFVWNKHPSIS